MGWEEEDAHNYVLISPFGFFQKKATNWTWFSMFFFTQKCWKRLKICQRLACNYRSWFQVTCTLVRHEGKEGAHSKGTYLSKIELAK